MAEEGRTVAELRAIIERRRAVTVAKICSAVEESSMLRREQEAVKRLVRERVTAFADGVSALLPSVVDESVPVSVLFLEFIEQCAAELGDDLADTARDRIRALPAAG